jgi:hypothetical protein
VTEEQQMGRKGKPEFWDDNRDILLAVLVDEFLRGERGYLKRTARRMRKLVPKSTATQASINGVCQRLDMPRIVREFAEQLTVLDELKKAAEAEPLEADHPMLRESERKIIDLRRELGATRRKLDEADMQRNVTTALIEVIREEMVPLDPVKPMLVKHSETKYTVDGVLLLSDEHFDKIVPPTVTMGLEDFDFDIGRLRLERLARVVIGYVTHHLPLYHFERLWIFSLGDKLMGDIHDSKYRNHFPNSLRASIAVADLEAEFVAQLAPYFPGGVHMVCVPGNHTRGTAKPQFEDPTDNYDYLIAAGIHTRLTNLIDEGQVTIHHPDSWGALVDVRGWLNHIGHGDDVRGWAGFPWYGFDRKEAKVKALFSRVLDQPIDFFWHGHFHTPTERTTSDSTSFHNGAFYTTGGYELKKLSVGNIPRQEFLIFEDREIDRGFILKVPIYLRNREKERAFREGDLDPALGRALTFEALEGSTSPQAEIGLTPIIRAE